MLAIQWDELLGMPEGVREALDVVAAFDDALVHGFGRLDDAGTAALTALAGAVAGSPLGAPAADAVARASAGAIGPEALGALAGARAAVLGAVHDALAQRFDTASGRVRADWAGPEPSPGASTLAAGCRAWLQEVAITGWRGVDHELVAAADRTIEALWDRPESRRLAVLLDGFAAELHASCPIASLDRVPARRWADLWSRALLLTWREESPAAPETVAGRLLILGVDVHEHATAVQAQVHALLEAGEGPARRVRVSVSAAKVDTIVGPAVWQVLGEYPRLLQAVAEHRVLTITDTAITPSGDLLWSEANATLGEGADPFTTARVRLADALAPTVAPLDRDPVHLAEPILVEGYRIADGVLDLDGRRVPVELDRLPDCGPLTPALVAGSTACLGLLRWDVGGWALRPLAIQRTVKGVAVQTHTGDWAQGPTDAKVAKALAKSGDSVAVLRERAGRLLRK